MPTIREAPHKMTEIEEYPQTPSGSSTSRDEGSPILCACFDVSRSDVFEYMARPGSSIDGLFRDTLIGTKCTACLLDLDITLNDLHLKRAEDAQAKGTKVTVDELPGEVPIEHLDSAFFVCDGNVRTLLRIANFTPMFDDSSLAVEHKYMIWLMDEKGQIATRTDGIIEANKQIEVDFSKLQNCPARGWFLISCFPMSAGFYGTLRPQGLLVGDGWSSAFHLQPHHAASNFYRRIAIVVKTSEFKTHNTAFIFNGSRRQSKVNVELDSRESDLHLEYQTTVDGNGLCVVNLDEAFSSLPESEIMLLTVNSDTITKKYLATIRPDGQWSADHFPTLP